MKFFITATALITAASMMPTTAMANSFGSEYNAHERCKKDEDNRQVLGGLAGAVIGGVVGSQVSGNGARTEGSAIGAVVGGLAGVGLADKTVDCDPVYPTTGSIPAQTTQYGSTSYGNSQTYGTSQSYGTSQPHYDDRVTVSNHPVYSDPYYGAGAISQGTTQSTGSVTYVPSGNNSQYASQTYSAPSAVYTQPAATTRYIAQPVVQPTVYTSPPRSSQVRQIIHPYGSSISQTSYSPPNYSNTTYSQPSYSQQRTYTSSTPYRASNQTHYHGKYSCDMIH